jgi:hypothetical protein
MGTFTVVLTSCDRVLLGYLTRVAGGFRRMERARPKARSLVVFKFSSGFSSYISPYPTPSTRLVSLPTAWLILSAYKYIVIYFKLVLYNIPQHKAIPFRAAYCSSCSVTTATHMRIPPLRRLDIVHTAPAALRVQVQTQMKTGQRSRISRNEDGYRIASRKETTVSL